MMEALPRRRRSLRLGLALASASASALFVGLPQATGATGAAGSIGTVGAAGTVGAGYWHTSGSQILDAAGNPVRIAGINWYGFETPDAVAHGLWSADYKAVIDGMRKLGYNTLRIPFSNQMVETNPVPSNLGYYGNGGPINLDLKGLTSLQILDRIVAYAGQDGLKIILDDHRSEAGNSAEQNGLWYTSAYPNSAWLADWDTMAKRYAGNPTVIGFDLRNEPHTPGYTAYAAGATWGSGDAGTDWRLAAQAAGNKVIADDPGALVFVEGISNYPDATVSGGYSTDWWGGNLDGAAGYPVTLSSAGHVVYSAHDYGPHEFAQTWFNATTTPASLGAVWDKHWGYLAKQGIAPVWVGEFGTPNAATDAADSTAGSQGQWFSSLVSYIKANNLSWTYWALNGEDPYALLDNGYDPTPVSAAKQTALNGIEFPLSAAPSPSPSASASASPTPSGSCTVTYTRSSEWAGGFNGVVDIKNTGTAAVNGWTLTFTFGGDQKITNFYSAAVTQAGAKVTASNLGYNAAIAPGADLTFGFQGTWSASDATPTGFALNGTACG